MKASEQKILAATLAVIPRLGWTPESFAAGAKKAGASPASAQKLFPRGIDDIATAFHASINDAMLARIKAKRNFSALRVRDKIAFAVRTRLEAAEKNREALRRLLVWSLLPRNIAEAARHLWQAADAIWIAAGDKSDDYNRYTKRILLIAVMKATLAFWLNDESKGRADTWEFLDRRIDDVLKLGKGIGALKAVGISDLLSLARRFAA